MKIFKDKHSVLADKSFKDFLSSELTWVEFLKNLGVFQIDYHRLSDIVFYEILDEQKWMLAKIKYGI